MSRHNSAPRGPNCDNSGPSNARVSKLCPELNKVGLRLP
jgi:hypothetical protein